LETASSAAASGSLPGNLTRTALRVPGRVRALAAAMVVASAAIAGSALPAAAADPLTVTTPYPLVAVEPGANVTFPLTVTSTTAGTVSLTLRGVPDGWTANLTGGGFTVSGVYATADKPGTVNLDVTAPAAASGSASITVDASGPAGTASLPVSIKVASEAGGSVSMEAAYPSLKGAASASFSFDVTLHNQTPRDTTFALAGQGVQGWTVNVLPGGSSQATSLKVAAGSTGSLTVTVTPAADAAAGTYPVAVTADGGGQQVQVRLQVEITGSYSMSLSTPDQVLSTTTTAGESKTFSFVVANTGSGPLTNVALAVTPPTGWNVAFNPTTVATIAPNASANVSATITPASDAVAGDYSLSFSASAAEARDAQAIRVTVNTSMRFAIIGGALIVLVLIGLGFVFSRYGRR
jgi:uncharacterized membrane protein